MRFMEILYVTLLSLPFSPRIKAYSGRVADGCAESREICRCASSLAFTRGRVSRQQRDIVLRTRPLCAQYMHSHSLASCLFVCVFRNEHGLTRHLGKRSSPPPKSPTVPSEVQVC